VGHNDNRLAGATEGKVVSDREFEQYKLAVEMEDRVRARRQLTNSFYATINVAIIGEIAAKDIKQPISIIICVARSILSNTVGA
jgi:hypothetical protein